MENALETRDEALKILVKVEKNRAYLNRLLAAQGHKSGETPWVQQVTKGVLQNLSRLDGAVQKHLKNPLSSLGPEIKNILRIAAYQIFFMSSVNAKTVVFESVELAKRYSRPGKTRLVNAVLRRLSQQDSLRRPVSGDKVQDIAEEFSHPQWLIKRWLDLFGEEKTRALCEWDNSQPPLCIRTNRLKIATVELRGKLEAAGFKLAPAPYIPDCTILHKLPAHTPLFAHELFKAGLFMVQDESSAAVTLFLDPQPGETIVEMCSAPGGKTAHAAEIMNNRGKIIAVDLSPSRLALVSENCARLGITIVEPQAADGRTYVPPFNPDRITLDAPCSGLGTLARKTDLRWNRSESDLPELNLIQSALIEQAASLLSEGGVLLYSTCTIDPSENESIVEAFLERHTDFAVLPPPSGFPSELLKGSFFSSFSPRHRMGGAFAARLVRRKRADDRINQPLEILKRDRD